MKLWKKSDCLYLQHYFKKMLNRGNQYIKIVSSVQLKKLVSQDEPEVSQDGPLIYLSTIETKVLFEFLHSLQHTVYGPKCDILCSVPSHLPLFPHI